MRAGALPTKSLVAVILAVVLVSFLLIFGLVPYGVLLARNPATSVTSTVERITTPSSPGDSGTSSSLKQADSSPSSASGTFVSSVTTPLIGNGSITLSYPVDYNTLAGFLLGRINEDRGNFSLPPVAPSPIASAQQHADSMLYYGYFSHWDTQGYKPYMRYTLMNGSGYVEENVAFESTNFPLFTSRPSVEQALSRLEFSMMYNDSACCQNGHRENILTPLHDRVSIGIAYNSTRLYVVEDFENEYLSLARPYIGQDGVVSLVGNSSLTLNNPQVWVYYDKYPQSLNKTELWGPLYSGSYDSGVAIGGAVPPCLFACEKYSGTTVQAQTWSVSSRALDIQFRLADFEQAYGAGVYTVYVVEDQTGTSQPQFLLCVSFFYG